MKILRWFVLTLIIVCLILPVMPVKAQVSEPTSTFTIDQLEVYRNVLELNDQLYLISATIKYTTNPSTSIQQAYLIRLKTAAGVELGSTTFYAYPTSGYQKQICSIYFSAATAPAWNQPYVVYIEGNPTLHWLDSSAVTAMSGAIADDGGVLTDETAASNNVAANDMTILPAIPAVNDAYYFGSSGMFNQLTVNIGTNGAWTGTYAWEYYNGSAWVSVSGLTDGTTGFTAGTGSRTVSYTCPTDWQQAAVNGTVLYWLRFRIATYTAVVTQPLGTQSWTNTLATPPSINSNVWSLWYDGSTVVAGQSRLTTRLRAVVQDLQTDWGATPDLWETVSGVIKLTAEGAFYFEATIDGLRQMCPDLFLDVVSAPSFPDSYIARDSYMEADDTFRAVYLTTRYAQTFTASDNYKWNGAWFKVYISGAPGLITIELRTTVAGIPGAAGTIVATGTLTSVGMITDTGGKWYQIAATTDYTLTKGTVYGICLSMPADLAPYLAWRYDSAGTYANGQACRSLDAGATWAALAGQDFMFAVTASDAFSASYRDRLAARLVGTTFDMTALAAHFNTSRMWVSTLVWFALCMLLAVGSSYGAKNIKLTTMAFTITVPFGAFIGFIYLEVAIIVAFLCVFMIVQQVFLSKGG